MNEILRQNAMTFKVDLYNKITHIGSASSFIGAYKGEYMLFTNYHVVAGKSNSTKIPDVMIVWIPTIIKNSNGMFIGFDGMTPLEFKLYKTEFLYDPIWVEHPERKLQNKPFDYIDCVGIPLNFDHLEYISYNIDQVWHNWDVGDYISIVGFPYGESANNMPIWKKGFLATELSRDYSNLPVFLIDCRAKEGQSGSPAVGQFRAGDIIFYDEEYYIAKNTTFQFLGIYSGRFQNTDLGIVWKNKILIDIFNAKGTSI